MQTRAKAIMFLMATYFRKLALFFSTTLLHRHFTTPKRKLHDSFRASSPQLGFQKFRFLGHRPNLENQVLIFHAERVLLRSSSTMFPYFMLVAFEAGSLIRALILFLIYPFIHILREDIALKIMVMVSFFGLRKDRFVEGRAVLPKFFLEDVGRESFEVLRRGKVTMAVSDLPNVMVESFLKDYLEFDYVFGRDLKVFCGYFVGLMEERRDNKNVIGSCCNNNVIGVGCFRKWLDCAWLSNCKEIYLVSEQEKRNWDQLPIDLYPKPLIFHDGRLAFRPTFLATLVMFMWLPVGIFLAIIRIIISLTLPFQIKIPLLHFTGATVHIFNSKKLDSHFKENRNNNGVLYVCNHRTLLDPLLLSYCLKTPLTAVVYSLSRVSEIISPIKTVRLFRNREKDYELMHELLRQGNLVVCPEGTTCREPYLLRFSPLFTEISQEIYPVALDCHVNMFYGTTARGFKCLDPVFFLMNPRASYTVQFLDMVRGCGDEGGISKFEMANLVQGVIGKELGFSCTKLTRKDKYLTLAGNEGIVKDGSKREKKEKKQKKTVSFLSFRKLFLS